MRFPVLLVAWAVVMLLQAGRLDYWGDEIGSLEGASESAVSILKGRGADFHPPLYFLLLHGWQRMVGYGESAVRSLSILAGAGTIVLTAALAGQLGLAQPGMAALLLALSPFWVLFCGMARYYGLSALVFVAVLLLFCRALGRGSPTRWLASAAMMAVAGYTNYLMAAAAVVIQGAYVMAYARSRVRPWLFSMAIAALLVAPFGALILSQTKGMMMWGERASFAGEWRSVILSVVYPVYVLAASETVLPWRVWFSVPLLVTSAYLIARGRRPLAITALVVGLAVGAAVVLFIARSMPLVYLPSRLLFLAPIWAVLLAAGAERAGRRRMIALGVLVIGYAGGLWNLYRGLDYHNVSYLVPWRQVVRLIRADSETDKLVVTTEEYPLLYYGRGLRFQLVRPGQRVSMDLALRAPRVVWLVQRDRGDRQHFGVTSDAETWLEEHYGLDERQEYVKLTPMELKVRQFLLRRQTSPAALTVSRFLRRW